eukprot:g31084.t1
MEPDEAWCQGLAAVQTALERDFQEELQYLPADHLGLPALFRRMFDLEGHKLTPAQKGGLAVALVVPGTGLITAGGIGTALLLRKARQAGSEDDPLERLFTKCLEEAKIAIRRKLNPIESRLGLLRASPIVKVCVQAQESLVPHVPLGSLGQHGVNTAILELGQSCQLRPTGSDVIILRVFRPSLINEPIHEAVEVWRGAKVILVPNEDGLVKCYAVMDMKVGQPMKVELKDWRQAHVPKLCLTSSDEDESLEEGQLISVLLPHLQAKLTLGKVPAAAIHDSLRDAMGQPNRRALPALLLLGLLSWQVCFLGSLGSMFRSRGISVSAQAKQPPPPPPGMKTTPKPAALYTLIKEKGSPKLKDLGTNLGSRGCP